MATELIINATLPETRIALLEDGEIQELHIERDSEKGIVGNVYKGRVLRVLPGMQAAFVDIGLEKAAFLYVDDVYFPDMQRELATNEIPPEFLVPASQDEVSVEDGDRKKRSRRGRAAVKPIEIDNPEKESEKPTAVVSLSKELSSKISELEQQLEAEAGLLEHDWVPDAISVAGVPNSTNVLRTLGFEDHGLRLQDEIVEDDGLALAESVDVAEVPAAQDVQKKSVYASGIKVEKPGVSAFSPPSEAIVATSADGERTIPVLPLPIAKKVLAEEEGDDLSESLRHPRNRGRVADEDFDGDEDAEGDDRGGGDFSNERESYGAQGPSISDLIKEGQEILVQVAKDPIGTKGARLTCHISLPGRFLVFMPTVDHTGVSRRIESDGERRKLKELIGRIKPEGTGVIVRTASGKQHELQLKSDLDYLVDTWNEMQKKFHRSRAPSVIYQDLNITLRAMRDMFTEEVDRVVVDSEKEYRAMVKFVSRVMPTMRDRVVEYTGKMPIFDALGIESEISKSLERKVWLKSGGYLMIDQAEALVAIDVNTGRYVGKKTLEETILKTNLEAVKEIAYQIRVRNFGGIIILDLIDMEKESSREKVYKTLEEELKKDRARPSILKISSLGLIEMTRKRTRDSMVRALCESCSYCEGRGFTRNKLTLCYDIMRDIEREAPLESTLGISVQCHPTVADVLTDDKRDVLAGLEHRFGKSITVRGNGAYHHEHYELTVHQQAKSLVYSREERIQIMKSRIQENAGKPLDVRQEKSVIIASAEAPVSTAVSASALPSISTDVAEPVKTEPVKSVILTPGKVISSATSPAPAAVSAGDGATSEVSPVVVAPAVPAIKVEVQSEKVQSNPKLVLEIVDGVLKIRSTEPEPAPVKPPVRVPGIVLTPQMGLNTNNTAGEQPAGGIVFVDTSNPNTDVLGIDDNDSNGDEDSIGNGTSPDRGGRNRNRRGRSRRGGGQARHGATGGHGGANAPAISLSPTPRDGNAIANGNTTPDNAGNTAGDDQEYFDDPNENFGNTLEGSTGHLAHALGLAPAGGGNRPFGPRNNQARRNRFQRQQQKQGRGAGAGGRGGHRHGGRSGGGNAQAGRAGGRPS